MIEKANASRTVGNESCGNVTGTGGWRNILGGPLFKTDSKVYGCCTLVWGPENLPYCMLILTTFFCRAEIHAQSLS